MEWKIIEEKGSFLGRRSPQKYDGIKFVSSIPAEA